MLLKNNAARLVTINGPMENGKRSVAYQIKPGENPAVEVPDELCKNKFVESLIKDGTLTVLTATAAAPAPADELDGMTKAELTEMATGMGIDVAARWTKDEIIAAIRAAVAAAQ